MGSFHWIGRIQLFNKNIWYSCKLSCEYLIRQVKYILPLDCEEWLIYSMVHDVQTIIWNMNDSFQYHNRYYLPYILKFKHFINLVHAFTLFQWDKNIQGKIKAQSIQKWLDWRTSNRWNVTYYLHLTIHSLEQKESFSTWV